MGYRGKDEFYIVRGNESLLRLQYHHLDTTQMRDWDIPHAYFRVIGILWANQGKWACGKIISMPSLFLYQKELSELYQFGILPEEFHTIRTRLRSIFSREEYERDYKEQFDTLGKFLKQIEKFAFWEITSELDYIFLQNYFWLLTTFTEEPAKHRNWASHQLKDALRKIISGYQYDVRMIIQDASVLPA